jgi:hypothetical protein
MKELHIPKIRELDLRKRPLGTTKNGGMVGRASALIRQLDLAIPTLWDHPHLELEARASKKRLQYFIERRIAERTDRTAQQSRG